MEDQQTIDLTLFRADGARCNALATASTERVSVRIRGEFLKGPIPLVWLRQAAALPGKALHVGIAIWFEHGRRKKARFGLTTAVLARFGVARKAGYAGLAALERAKLILVARRHGKNPVVTVLEAASDRSEPTMGVVL